MSRAVETKTALLPSAGYNYNKWTKHEYSHSELITLPSHKTGGPATTGLGHMFRCAETGELRRWGFEATAQRREVEGN